MPYRNVQEAQQNNPGIHTLNPAQKRAWTAVFNNAKSRGLDDASAAKESWAAAGRVKIKKVAPVSQEADMYEPLAKSMIELEDDRLAIGIPFEKIDIKARTVSGFATLDNIDKSGEIVDFAASQTAFSEWPGNIREMHGTTAVGKALSVTEGEKDSNGQLYKGFYVTVHISKGAESTWQKILDGTLQAFSVGGRVYEKRPEIVKAEGDDKYAKRQVYRITKYALTELSVVDNPANPLAMFDDVKKAEGLLVKYEDEELRTTALMEMEEKSVFYCKECDIAKVEDPSPESSDCVSCNEPMMLVATTYDTPDAAFVKMVVLQKLQEEAESEGGKLSKAETNYRPAVGEEACSNCVYYIQALGKCEKVEDQISANYTCDVFAERTDAEVEVPAFIEVYNNVTQKFDAEHDIEKVAYVGNMDNSKTRRPKNLKQETKPTAAVKAVETPVDEDVKAVEDLLSNSNDDINVNKYLFGLISAIAEKVKSIDNATKAQGGDFEKVDTQGLKDILDILKSAFGNVEEVLTKAGIVNLNSENANDVSVTQATSLPAGEGADNAVPGHIPADGTDATEDSFASKPGDSNVLPHMGKAEETEGEKVEKVDASTETEDDSDEMKKFTDKVVGAFETMGKGIEDISGRLDKLENSGAGRKSGEVNEELSKSAKDMSFWGGSFWGNGES